LLTFVGVDSSGTPILLNQTMSAVSFGNGVAEASLTITDFSLAAYLAPGLVTPNLTIENASGSAASILSTFPTESVTYNYTPFSPAPAPEPPSIALLAVGLAALGWTVRRRRLSELV
jgi:PEP-CTERM motif